MSDSRGRRARVSVAREKRGSAPGKAGVRFNRQMMEEGIRLFLRGMGPAVSPSILDRTPRLVAEAWIGELLSGYRGEGEPLISPLEEPAPDTLVAVRGIRFVSICRHHLLPFQGTAAVGYLPDRRLAGFSSVARLVDHLARRLQIQEELSEGICERLERSLAPRGVACLLEATHQCMTCRGAAQPESRIATLRVRGIFEKDSVRRREVISLLQSPPSPREAGG